MRKIFVLMIVAFAFWGVREVNPQGYDGSENDSTTLVAAPHHISETMVIAGLLNQHHYRKIQLDDSLSSVIFDNYIQSLDYNKAYFLAADIEYFEKYRDRLDDDIKKGNLDVPYQIFRVFEERTEERLDSINALIDRGFSFDSEEYYEVDRTDSKWSSTKEELDEVWRKILKSQALSLKLGGKEDENIQETLKKRYDRYGKIISQYKSEDVFQLYMNSFAESYDPHTNYFSPISSENFRINMSLSLEGIGARLTTENDYTTVYEIVPGGPAFKSKRLFKDDKIVGVAQDDSGEFVDVFGWRLDDVVQLIRGPKGTVVRLQIIEHDAPAGAKPAEVRMVRDQIKLEAAAAKKEVVPITYNNATYKLGVITLPSFYLDFDAARRGDQDFRSSTRDVKRLLDELKAENVDGVMIDLRNNGGGSLQEAVDLTGLFIPFGPVVQVKSSNGRVEVHSDTDYGSAYNGPLAVMVNRFSASASEIFSGAIKDYKRGVIIGETTFGKGSVQNLISLDRFLPKEEDRLGQLKLTLAQYYRVSGSSTQAIGVSPDIQFPTFVDRADFGEGSRPNALPWDKISEIEYLADEKISPELVAQLNTLFQERLATNEELKEYIQDLEEARERRNRTEISLNYQERKTELDALNEENEDMSQSLESSEVEDVSEEEAFSDDLFMREAIYLLAEMASKNVDQ